jgi:hypothetical protein
MGKSCRIGERKVASKTISTDADLNIVRVIRDSDLSSYKKLDSLDVGKWGIFGSRSVIVCENYKKASDLSSALNRCI